MLVLGEESRETEKDIFSEEKKTSSVPLSYEKYGKSSLRNWGMTLGN